MPCQGPTPDEIAMMRRRENEEKFGVDTSDLDLATRSACEALKVLERDHPKTYRDKIGNITKKWFSHHKMLDRDRVRQQALAKLTEEEREVLGL